MFIDFNEHPDGQQIDTDICIIGAGAAGITLVHALRDSGLDVCLLESGGLTPETASRQLLKPEARTGDYISASCRLRQFGGTTNHWGGNSKPLDELDFMQRDWVEYSGWPIDRATVEPYYAEANRLVGGGVYAYRRAEMTEAGDWPYPDIDLKLLDDVYWRVSLDATGFSRPYRETFESAPNVRVFVNATVLRLDANAGVTTVQTASVRATSGDRTCKVRARVFVVAAGCMDSARLLLASNDVVPTGLGNSGDNVGRFFMMHPHVDIGRVIDMDTNLDAFFRRYPHGGAEVIAGLSVSPEIQAAEKILNGGIQLEGVPDTTSGYYAFRQMTDDLKKNYTGWKMGAEDIALSDDFDDWMWMALKDLDSVARGLWKRYEDPRYLGSLKIDEANIYIQTEQAPNPASRLTLGTDTDALGMPRLIQDCRVLPIDKRTLRVSGEVLGRELGRLGAGRVRLNEWLLDDDVAWDAAIWGGCHHMGATRMSTSATDGVVDANCRIHDLDNAYVASSGVFSTGGHANPTITIVALALRLAEHLQRLPDTA